jgi:hypothetical protein
MPKASVGAPTKPQGGRRASGNVRYMSPEPGEELGHYVVKVTASDAPVP